MIRTSIYPEDSSYKNGRADEHSDMLRNGYIKLPTPGSKKYQELRERIFQEMIKHKVITDIVAEKVLAILRGEEK